MDDYIALAILKSQDQLNPVANAIMTGIHDVFLPDKDDMEDAISLKKILKKEAAWAIIKTVLGFEFDGDPGDHTIWLTEDRCTNILTELKKWIMEVENIKKGIPFVEFRTYLEKLRYVFITIPSVKGLLSPCNQMLGKEKKISSCIKTNPYCRLSVIVSTY